MIETEGLEKRFRDFVALRALDLRVDAGEVFGFLGPNGAGKSTTTKLLTTLLRPTAGAARVAGFDVVREADDVRRNIGYLPERVPVFKPLTAREDLRYFAELHRMPKAGLAERIEEVLSRVGLTGVEHRTAGTFSKGMTQRLGIARAILHEPKVLFLDEPATGLDPTGRRGIRELMKSLSQEGRTIFLCSHDLGEVRAVCKRVGFIRQGELVDTRAVGEAVEARLLEYEFDGDAAVVAAAAREVKGVIEADAEDGLLRVRGSPECERRAVSRAVHRAGGAVLDVREKEESIEALYEKFVESEAMATKKEEAA